MKGHAGQTEPSSTDNLEALEEYLSSQLCPAYLAAKIEQFTLQGYALVRFYVDLKYLQNKIITKMTEQHAF